MVGFKLVQNLYEILNVTENSTPADIKKAYIKMLREYPVEKYPEEFKKIRKAYEILSDPVSRKEYETMYKYGDEIKFLEEQSFLAFENRDFETAISNLKKILLIDPSLRYIRNQLARAYMYNGDLEKAIEQSQKLINMQPENAIYHYNLAFAYEKFGLTDEAVHHFKEAYRLDPNDINTIYSLSELYIGQKDYRRARQTIEDALRSKSNEGFHKFYYLFKLVEIDILEQNEAGIKKTFSRIETLLEKHPEEKSYVAREYGKFAYELNNVMMFDWAKKLTERAIELDPTDELIEALHKYTTDNDEILKEYRLLNKDEKLLDEFKHASALYIYGSTMEEDKRREQLDILLDNLDFVAKNMPEETIASIKKMMIKFPLLYEAYKELYIKVMEQAQTSKNERDQFERLRRDPLITSSILRLVALYLSSMEEDERRFYFNNITNEMSHEPAFKVKRSIERLKTDYPALYELNPNFFEKIMTIIRQSQPARASYGTNNDYRESDQPVNRGSNSSACFVATAAFGSPLATELNCLRYWRDHFLVKTAKGRFFVSFYYKIGPFAASIVRRSPFLKRQVRKIIWRILAGLENKYSLKSRLNEIGKGDTMRWKND